MGVCAGRVGHAVQAGPGGRGQLDTGFEAVEVDRVVTGPGVLAGFVVDRLRALRRRRPVAHHRHQRRGAFAAREPYHRCIRVVVGRWYAARVGERNVRVDGREVGRAVGQRRARRGEAGVQLLAGRGRVADEFLVVERGRADQAIGIVDRTLRCALREHSGRKHGQKREGGEGAAASEQGANLLSGRVRNSLRLKSDWCSAGLQKALEAAHASRAGRYVSSFAEIVFILCNTAV